MLGGDDVVGVVVVVVDGRIGEDFDDVANEHVEHADVGAEDVAYVAGVAAEQEVVVQLACFAVE